MTNTDRPTEVDVLRAGLEGYDAATAQVWATLASLIRCGIKGKDLKRLILRMHRDTKR